MQRNRRRIVMLIVVSLIGVMAFAFAYRVIAGNGAGGQAQVVSY